MPPHEKLLEVLKPMKDADGNTIIPAGEKK